VSALPGSVLDPFMGSGAVAKVTRKLGRGYVGIEKNRRTFKIAGQYGIGTQASVTEGFEDGVRVIGR